LHRPLSLTIQAAEGGEALLVGYIWGRQREEERKHRRNISVKTTAAFSALHRQIFMIYAYDRTTKEKVTTHPCVFYCLSPNTMGKCFNDPFFN
jgi:hypothetical protein